MSNEFGCDLFINTGEFHPDIVTELTTVASTTTIIKGSPYLTPQGKIIPNKVFEENLWIFKSKRFKESTGFHLNEAISFVIEQIEKNEKGFINVFEKFEQKHLNCYAYFYEYNPYFRFDRLLQKRLQQFSIDIEFDLYFLGEEGVD